MDDAADRFLGRIVAIFLLCAVVANLAGVTMFMIRDGPVGLAPSWAFFVTERSLFIAAVVLSALGFCLLDGRLSSYVLARLGILTYFAAAIVGVVAETIGLTGSRNYPVVVAYVVLAFTGQAVIGSALAASGLVPRWVGWATVLWNLSWLVGLVLAHPQNVYFPVLHLVTPALIGVTLFVEAASSARRPPPGAVDVEAPA